MTEAHRKAVEALERGRDAINTLDARYGHYDDGEPKDWSEYIEARTAADDMLAALAALREEGEQGRDGVQWFSPEVSPPVKVGTEAFVLVAVRRAHNGKTVSFPAVFLNQKGLEFQDDPFDRTCTGFYTYQADEDAGETYYPLIDDGSEDALVAWAMVPQYVPAALSSPKEQGRVPEGWVAVIDRIVPETPPVPDDEAERYHCEWAIHKDRSRIRRELLALSASPAPPIPEAEGK